MAVELEEQDAGRLVSINSGSIATYKYDGQHRRFRKNVGGNTTTYITASSGQVLTEYTQDSLATDYIYLNGRPLAKITSTGEKLYFINTHLGTPVVLVDSAKTVRWSADWYPFGDIYDEQVSATNEIRFPGQWRDAESGLHYIWHRYYDPDIGRYMQADLIGLLGGINLYEYGRSNPCNIVDPFGLKCKNSYWERVEENFRVTNETVWGMGVRGLVAIWASTETSNLLGSATFLRWVTGGVRGVTMQGVAFTGLETGVVSVGAGAVNASIVVLSWGVGTGIGSLINAAIMPCEEVSDVAEQKECD